MHACLPACTCCQFGGPPAHLIIEHKRIGLIPDSHMGRGLVAPAVDIAGRGQQVLGSNASKAAGCTCIRAQHSQAAATAGCLLTHSPLCAATTRQPPVTGSFEGQWLRPLRG